MNTHIQTHPTKWLLLVGPRSIRFTMMILIARLAELRGRTDFLKRVSLSRMFTCYQVFASLENAVGLPAPLIVLDFLHTFYDESISFAERRRLLECCIPHLERLSKPAGGAVSIHPPALPSPEADALFAILKEAAPEIWIQEMPVQAPQPLRLF
jgi:hypothetical protein